MRSRVRKRAAAPARAPARARAGAPGVSRVLFLQTWRSQGLKMLIVFVALTIWGSLLPIVYGAFGKTFQDIIQSGLIPPQLTQFGGGDIFSLSGSISLGAIHPISLILNSVFAVGFATAAVAGERQRGTLEVLLARPLSRRAIYVTLLVATLTFVAVAVLATILGAILGSAVAGVLDQLKVDRLPLVWLNGFLLFSAIAAIGLAASVSFDRLTPALGITAGDRRGHVLPRGAGDVLARREGPPAVLAVPLLPAEGGPRGHGAGDQLRAAGGRRGRRDRLGPRRVPAPRPGRAELSAARHAA